jgi:hypothetical protein
MKAASVSSATSVGFHLPWTEQLAVPYRQQGHDPHALAVDCARHDWDHFKCKMVSVRVTVE